MMVGCRCQRLNQGFRKGKRAAWGQLLAAAGQKITRRRYSLSHRILSRISWRGCGGWGSGTEPNEWQCSHVDLAPLRLRSKGFMHWFSNIRTIIPELGDSPSNHIIPSIILSNVNPISEKGYSTICVYQWRLLPSLLGASRVGSSDQCALGPGGVSLRTPGSAATPLPPHTLESGGVSPTPASTC